MTTNTDYIACPDQILNQLSTLMDYFCKSEVILNFLRSFGSEKKDI